MDDHFAHMLEPTSAPTISLPSYQLKDKGAAQLFQPSKVGLSPHGRCGKWVRPSIHPSIHPPTLPTPLSTQTFTGPRPGMVFKRGPRGVGYYEDAYEMSKVSRWWWWWGEGKEGGRSCEAGEERAVGQVCPTALPWSYG